MGLRSIKKIINIYKREGFTNMIIAAILYMRKNNKEVGSRNDIWTKVGKKYLLSDNHFIINRTSTRRDYEIDFAWIIPPPGKGSGGHINIFRFIQCLEDKGWKCAIYIYSEDIQSLDMDAVNRIAKDSYPKVKASMSFLGKNSELGKSSSIFATSWETAYLVRDVSFECNKFYFVQDFEPYFFPRGSMYTFAENTYKMGFFGITAGSWLSSKLSNEYGMLTDYYNFGYDRYKYKLSTHSSRNEILFYVRPYTERRGFEIGIIALEIFSKMHPEIKINLVGWDVSNYNIDFPYTNLKTLEPDDLPELYNRCVAGLVLSYTNMSLLPLELLACGTIPVINDSPSNHLVENDDYFVYAQESLRQIAEALCVALNINSREG